jgi:hypothetical protein
VVRYPNGRGNPAAFWWWLGHGIALIVLCSVTLARGANTAWYWIIGTPLAVSCYAGQYVINRRSHRSGPTQSL